jgi:hypothetical protein
VGASTRELILFEIKFPILSDKILAETVVLFFPD